MAYSMCSCTKWIHEDCIDNDDDDIDNCVFCSYVCKSLSES